MPRRRPLAICGSTEGMLLNMAEICPAINSVIAGAVPLYGMCTRLTPAIDFSNSMPMCCGLPGPTEP